MEGPPLLGVAALQLETQAMPTAANLAHADELLDAECRRLGVRRYDGGPGSGSEHLDLLVLPEAFNIPYFMNEASWYNAEGLQSPAQSPSLTTLSTWAKRYRCYAAATLLEATPDGHMYNSLVLATPDGDFITRPSAGGNSGWGSSSGGSGGGGGSGVALVRKYRAASLEGFVFRSAGRPGRGGEPAAHEVEIDVAPLLQKRGSSGGSASGGSASGGSASGGSASGGSAPPKLRLAFAICYENLCWDFMHAVLDAHCQQPIDLLIAPFCAMASRPDHPTFKWPAAAAERFAAQAAGVAQYHALKLGVHVVAAHHSGPWTSHLPRLLPFLPRDPVPLSGPMLGCSAVFAPGGAPIAQLKPSEEGLVLTQLPLLKGPHTAVAAASAPVQLSKLACSELTAVFGAAAAESARGGPAAPYACYPGGYVVEPVGWQVRWGFPLMELLGSFSYHVWLGHLRARVARTIASEGVWVGPMPELDRGGCRWVPAALAAGALIAAVRAVGWVRRA